MFKIVVFLSITAVSLCLMAPTITWAKDEQSVQEEKGHFNVINISLSYPQKSNAPARALPRQQPPAKIEGKVFVRLKGLKSEQQGKSGVYVEYFLDVFEKVVEQGRKLNSL